MELNNNIAGLGKRFLALIIDCVVVIILNYIISSILLRPYGGLTGAMGLKDFQFGEDLVSGAFSIFSALFALFIALIGGLMIAFVYEFLMIVSPKQATVGKMLMHIQVVKSNGEALGIAGAFMRTLLKFASVFLWFLPWFIAVFTKQKQAIHDLLANSVVIER
jgi:uncharacterized RDD family membrane protein YckC